MVYQEFLFTIFFIELFVLTLMGLYAFYSYYKKLSQYKKVEEEAYKKAQDIILDAQKKSEAILQKVETKAEEILTHSQLFRSDLEDAYKKSLQHSGEKYVQLLEQHSKQFVDEYTQLLTKVKEQMSGEVSKSIQNIESKIQENIRDSIKTVVEQAEEEVNKYKKEELAKIDQNLDELVVRLAKELLRISLTPKDHKKLILNALEKAKQQRAFFI